MFVLDYEDSLNIKHVRKHIKIGIKLIDHIVEAITLTTVSKSPLVDAINFLCSSSSQFFYHLTWLFFYFLYQPILVYMSKVDGKFEFSPISVNFLTEAAKVLFAVVMLLLQVLSTSFPSPFLK